MFITYHIKLYEQLVFVNFAVTCGVIWKYFLW